jgi:hypothetical protein
LRKPPPPPKVKEYKLRTDIATLWLHSLVAQSDALIDGAAIQADQSAALTLQIKNMSGSYTVNGCRCRKSGEVLGSTSISKIVGSPPRLMDHSITVIHQESDISNDAGSTMHVGVRNPTYVDSGLPPQRYHASPQVRAYRFAGSTRSEG